MKAYVYGEYVRAYGSRRVKEFWGVTNNIVVAFTECYAIGLDGNDYFLFEFDPDRNTKKTLYINDADYHLIWCAAKRTLENKMHTRDSKPLRAENV